MRSWQMAVWTVLATAFGALATARPSLACSGGSVAATTALPGSGAVDVSPMSSIFVVTGSASPPNGLSLTAGGQAVPMPNIDLIGSRQFARRAASFWRLSAPLLASTPYVLSASDATKSNVLTTFTTAASYDKEAGQAPVLAGLRLWRVRYPIDQIGAGGCVFAEYEGYIDIDYQDGTLPGTPAEETIGRITLEPRTGGLVQTLVFAGIPHFYGGAWTQGQSSNPDGTVRSPTVAWNPTLEPDREYCVTISLYGRNDRASLPIVSNRICSNVMNVDAQAGGGSSSSGCQVGRGETTSWSVWLALAGLTSPSPSRRSSRISSDLVFVGGWAIRPRRRAAP
jgi:hypothetical protein